MQDGTDIVILDSRWKDAVDSLRSLDRQGALLCQGCKQPLRLRAGEVRRWHFAHKHLENCGYGHESPELLNARAILYEWLVGKFGKKVTIEKKVDDTRFSRPIDCWVEQENESIAYWIVDAAIKPQIREKVQAGFRQLRAIVNWVFITQMLHEDKDEPEHLHLTTTERELMQHTAYDDAVKNGYGAGKSLHYLNADDRTLTTYRGLHLAHSPQLFKGHKERHELSAVLVSPHDGAFVHPGEHERLQQFKQGQAEREKQQRKWVETQTIVDTIDEQTKRDYATRTEPEGVCEFCGLKTSEWWSYDGKSGTCKCKACYRQGKF